MDKLFRVTWMNDFCEGHHHFRNSVATFSAAAGNDYLTGLFPASYGMEDDVFLQYTIIAKGSLAGIENMEPVKLQIA